MLPTAERPRQVGFGRSSSSTVVPPVWAPAAWDPTEGYSTHPIAGAPRPAESLTIATWRHILLISRPNPVLLVIPRIDLRQPESAHPLTRGGKSIKMHLPRSAPIPPRANDSGEDTMWFLLHALLQPPCLAGDRGQSLKEEIQRS